MLENLKLNDPMEKVDNMKWLIAALGDHSKELYVEPGVWFLPQL